MIIFHFIQMSGKCKLISSTSNRCQESAKHHLLLYTDARKVQKIIFHFIQMSGKCESSSSTLTRCQESANDHLPLYTDGRYVQKIVFPDTDVRKVQNIIFHFIQMPGKCNRIFSTLYRCQVSAKHHLPLYTDANEKRSERSSVTLYRHQKSAEAPL